LAKSAQILKANLLTIHPLRELIYESKRRPRNHFAHFL
jgi:hypothetical protein